MIVAGSQMAGGPSLQFPALSPPVVPLKIRGNFFNAACFPADERANPTGGGGECRRPQP